MSKTETTERKLAPKKIRHIRIGDDLWVKASVKAETEDGVTISELVRVLLDDYVRNGRR